MGNNCRRTSVEVDNVKVSAGIASAELGRCVSSCCMGLTAEEEKQHAAHDAEIERKAAKLDEIITAMRFVKSEEVMDVIAAILLEKDRVKQTEKKEEVI